MKCKFEDEVTKYSCPFTYLSITPGRCMGEWRYSSTHS